MTDTIFWHDYETLIAQKAKQENIPLIVVINKTDINSPDIGYIEKVKVFSKYILICSSIDQSNQNKAINDLKKLLIDVCPDDFLKPKDLISDLSELMREAADNLEFELAAELRDKIRELEQTLIAEKNN